MAERSTLRGSRLGSVSYEDDRDVHLAERLFVDYDCACGFTFTMPFSVEAEVPALWECRECGEQALRRDWDRPEEKVGKAPRTHWDMLLERRSVEELEELLQERLDLLRNGGMTTAELAAHASPTVSTRRGRKLKSA